MPEKAFGATAYIAPRWHLSRNDRCSVCGEETYKGADEQYVTEY